MGMYIHIHQKRKLLHPSQNATYTNKSEDENEVKCACRYWRTCFSRWKKTLLSGSMERMSLYYVRPLRRVFIYGKTCDGLKKKKKKKKKGNEKRPTFRGWFSTRKVRENIVDRVEAIVLGRTGGREAYFHTKFFKSYIVTGIPIEIERSITLETRWS